MSKTEPKTESQTPISNFIRHHYRHFNAAALVDAADAYTAHLDAGGHMLVTLAGAMSTAELGSVICRDDPPRQGADDLVYGREPWKKMYSTSSPTTFMSACRITATSPRRMSKTCSSAT